MPVAPSRPGGSSIHPLQRASFGFFSCSLSLKHQRVGNELDNGSFPCRRLRSRALDLGNIISLGCLRRVRRPNGRLLLDYLRLVTLASNGPEHKRSHDQHSGWHCLHKRYVKADLPFFRSSIRTNKHEAGATLTPFSQKTQHHRRVNGRSCLLRLVPK